MKRLIFDIETDGLLPDVSQLHCIVTKDVDTLEVKRFSSNAANVDVGIESLMEADELIGHNIMDYDLRVIQLICPRWEFNGIVTDTLVLSQLIWTDLKDRDFSFRKKHPDYPGNLIGSHSLRAWGYRLNNLKDDYTGGWEVWSQEMEDYCVQDVSATHTLWLKIQDKNYSPEAIQLEHDVKRIILRQSARGFSFNYQAATELYGRLSKRSGDLEDQLKQTFKPWYVNKGKFVPKVDNKKLGYTADAPFCKVELTEFNPGSRDHIAVVLQRNFRWKPTEFGSNGKPTVDESILEKLQYPGVDLIVEYLVVAKRIGQLSEGKQGLLRLVKDGRIHGKVNTNGAVTGRMTHNSPNVAQTPANRALYGHDFRSLYQATPGWLLTGADASGLELRCLAHYMAAWDGGAYGDIVLHGDIHTANQTAAELPTRDDAKTFIYAFLYGAGDAKIGSIIKGGAKRGKQLKEQFLAGLPALDKLLKAVKNKATKNGYVVGLDGRHIHIRSEHAALNSLLQGAGAIVMKKALVLLDDKLQELHLVPGVDYEFVANIHDEWQIEHKPEHTDTIQREAKDAITRSGEHFKFRCRLDGDAKTGRTWADTH